MTIMTTANKVTIGRIVLIPFFVFIMLDYIRDFIDRRILHESSGIFGR